MAYSSVQNPITLTGGGGGGGNSPPTIPMSTTRTCPYVSKTPSPSVFVLDSCRVPSVFNNALASRDYSYIPGALCFYIYLDIRWQRLPLQNCNCITEIKKKKKKSKVWTLGYVYEFDRGWDRWWCSSFWWGMEREREKYENGRNGWNNNFFFFFLLAREIFGLIFLSLKVSRDDGSTSIIRWSLPLVTVYCMSRGKFILLGKICICSMEF